MWRWEKLAHVAVSLHKKAPTRRLKFSDSRWKWNLTNRISIIFKVLLRVSNFSLIRLIRRVDYRKGRQSVEWFKFIAKSGEITKNCIIQRCAVCVEFVLLPRFRRQVALMTDGILWTEEKWNEDKNEAQSESRAEPQTSGYKVGAKQEMNCWEMSRIKVIIIVNWRRPQQT